MSKDWIEELMQLMCVPELPLDNIRAAQQMKYSRLPSRLFKFREVNEYSLNNLREATLHLTFASNFNDPYDSAVDFDPHFGATHAELLLDGIEAVDEFQRSAILLAEDPVLEVVKLLYGRAEQPVAVAENMLETIADVIRDNHTGFVAKTVNELNVKLQNSYKICSLTERLDSLPLWAHYAKNHAGFAMEYDFRSLPLENLMGLALWPVRYNGVFDASDLLKGVRTKRAFNNLFGVIAALHKSPDWSYEEEWRLVLPDSSSEPPQNYKVPLKAVFLGSKISEDNANLVFQAAALAEVPVFKMRLVSHEFRMEAIPGAL